MNILSNHLLLFLVSTSNAWGIFLIIFLLGYGLVAFPKNMLLNTEIRSKIKYLEWYAKETKDEIEKRKEYLTLILNVS